MPVQNKPIIHARDHEDGGADPVRGLLPKVAGDIEAVILATAPGAYYKLNETTGDWVDSADDRDAAYNTPAEGSPPTRGVDSDYNENDDALCVTVNGPDPEAGSAGLHIGQADSDLFAFAGSAPFTVSARVRLQFAEEDELFSMGVCGNVLTTSSGAKGWGLFLLSHAFAVSGDGPYGWPCIRRTTTGAVKQEVIAPAPVTAGEWVRLTGTYDGTTLKLYVDDSPAGTDTTVVSLPSGGTYEQFLLGGCGIAEGTGGRLAGLDGELDSVVVWDRALTDAEVGAIVDAAESSGGGEVVVIDPITGEPIWAPPGTEVEHGDGDPDEGPTSGSGAFLGPVDGAGWHLQLHYEYIVVYDSSPGRFDVPPRKWTRVPFNTVRIQRSWEHGPAGSGDFTNAWLPEDRGLTEHAKNGLLLVTAGMLFNFEWISGWFSTEYPAVDWARLPDDPTAGPDYYTRAARMTNTSQGSVLRRGTVGVWGELRAFVEWPFFEPNNAIPLAWGSDNPYPVYLAWAARPLTKPLPYPKLSNAESLDNYKDSVGGAGFDLENLLCQRPPVAGDAISLQAWQDSPYLLRFGTDKYPPYTPYNYVEQWRKRPALVLHHYYDPTTVDHATGALL